MWVFLSDSFLSIVAHRSKPGVLLVRARVAGDIERLFPGKKATLTKTADYRYRTEVPAKDVAAAIAGQVELIGYTNFKNSVADHERHKAYFDVWGAMNRLQSIKAKPPRRKQTSL